MAAVSHEPEQVGRRSMTRRRKIKTMTAKEDDLESLKIIKRANTGKIVPCLRSDGPHDFVVVGLNCMVCGGEILADGIGVTVTTKDGKTFDNHDGVVWHCSNCGEVNENGVPALYVTSPYETDTPMACSFCGLTGYFLALPASGNAKICRNCAAECLSLITKAEEKDLRPDEVPF